VTPLPCTSPPNDLSLLTVSLIETPTSQTASHTLLMVLRERHSVAPRPNFLERKRSPFFIIKGKRRTRFQTPIGTLALPPTASNSSRSGEGDRCGTSCLLLPPGTARCRFFFARRVGDPDVFPFLFWSFKFPSLPLYLSQEVVKVVSTISPPYPFLT